MIDAHNHLHLLPEPEKALKLSLQAGVEAMLVNGTQESDWQNVAQLCTKYPKHLLPSFGLHPWYVSSRTPDWHHHLREILIKHPRAALGECGLDRWREPFHLPEQIDCLRTQIRLAHDLGRPLTIHCLRAWGPLLELLEAEREHLPRFLLHSYSGNAELLTRFNRLGAYYSFSGYFLHQRKESIRQTFQAIPIERLLLETDAPSMLPPEEFTSIPLPNELNHPANLATFVPPLARLRNRDESSLIKQLRTNFREFFHHSSL